ncbi:hypothetical protein RC62_1160 [Flavobacterium aquidurense]|uniref:Uncharacterized protein n=1 Tax=Flavobacterium aquidurense TaxID=362413 RepID=A0A0Q0RS85_9FLAO|nr:hypothetical protein RC62_1160 [Flavobacterium aquidurense]
MQYDLQILLLISVKNNHHTLYINHTKNNSHYGLFIIERQKKNAKNSRQEKPSKFF